MKEPRKIMIGFQEGTCQLHCKKCPAFSNMRMQKPAVGKMPMDKAKKLIDEIALMEHVPIIAPNIYSEPFTNADIQEIIGYCAKKNIPLSIITNGILLNDNIIEFLLDTLDRRSALSFSLDAVSQEVYEEVRGEYLLKEIEDKIVKLVKSRGENSGPRITVSMTVEDENRHEQDAFLNKWKSVVDGVRITIAFDFNRRIPDQFKKKESEKVYSEVGCGELQNMVITADGHARVCCEDVFGVTDFGNVFDKGIMEVWKGMEPFRNRINSGLVTENDFCYGCEAGYTTKVQERKTEEFIIKESEYWVFYNKKSEWLG